MEQVSKGHAYAGMGIQLCCHTWLHKRLLHNQILMKDNRCAVLKHMPAHIQCRSPRKTLSILLCWKWDTASSTALQTFSKINCSPMCFFSFPLQSLSYCDVSSSKKLMYYRPRFWHQSEAQAEVSLLVLAIKSSEDRI